ncbi:hypothetical protein F5ESL0236_07880 [Lactobacillus sp. ESL0236]|uniref:phage holin, LLH family n=1 Tax=unclassified Lactobacillus TaxID=2620435 RepID=UPI000EFB7F29|nr:MULTISPECIES: phage holin, LLH family [unclassified Lactobacillus]RMC36912.1 hypothetical protein F5ESL0237_07955 [Lactobacillus sp. ESL0237]RMC42595.1 hypothetical protein F5ESL0234_07870 [Lactobacillus sp. ESL0234]RMC43257.1 hypothetical protein F5ESL0236_07880 [Lactobacillus sp. ESL0236]
MTKLIFDAVYAALFLSAILVGLYASKHATKNKALLFIEDLAAAFVRQAETTDLDGQAKMDNVISSVEDALVSHGIKVDATIEAVIRAFAEKEVAKMNANKKEDAKVEDKQEVQPSR